MEFEDLIKLLFAGAAPSHIEMLMQRENDFKAVIEKQLSKPSGDFNAAEYAKECMAMMDLESLIKLPALSEEKKAQLRQLIRVPTVLDYLNEMEDSELSVDKKYGITTTYLTIINTLTLAQGKDVLHNQETFIKALKKNKKKFEKQLNELSPKGTQEVISHDDTIPEISSEIKTADKIQEDKKYGILPVWIYGEAKLNRLSKELFRDGYTEEKDSFENIFRRDFPAKCNWLKNATSLLYLIYELLGDEEIIHPSILSLIQEKTLFKGQIKTKRRLQSQALQVYQVIANAKSTRGEYVDIDCLVKLIR